ncbi:Isochorismatase hydrolase [Jackrogersella minutella]|nr:Isochorismatase hydrolase [Jackrogersella minutella]
MKSTDTAKTALIIIDVQYGLQHPTYWGPSRSTPQCEDNVKLLLNTAREYNKKQGKGEGAGAGEPLNKVAICHVSHHSILPNSPLSPGARFELDGKLVEGLQPLPFARPEPDEPLFIKDVNSSFIGTELEAYLRGQKVRQLVIVGLTTDHCVSTTTRMASNLRVVSVTNPTGEVDEGDIVLVSDATAAFAKGDFDAETVHEVNLASLNGEFAQVVKTQDVLRVVFG